MFVKLVIHRRKFKIVYFRMIKCNCSEGFQGDRCQFKEDKISQSFLKENFTLKASFSRW